jgi:hypothetical protein
MKGQFAVIHGGRTVARPQLIANARKKTLAGRLTGQDTCINQYTRECIVRLAKGYTDLEIHSFRQVASAARAPESTVFAVIQNELRRLAPPRPFTIVERAA